MNAVTNFAKAHTALIGAIATWLVASLKDGHITGQEWWALPVAVATGLGVALVPNRKTRKTDTGAVGVAVAFAVMVILLALLLGFAVNHFFLFILLLLVLCFVL